MSEQSVMEWNAAWIWGSAEESPRNVWRCFRRSFEWPAIGGRHARLSITADSRYVLYVNGRQVGRGPVRSWPFEQRYDTYEVGHLLRAGEQNVVAVLVMHYGLSTFSYIRGRGGLLLQLDQADEEGQAGVPVLVTDDSWLTTPYAGYDERSPRMSCQLAFAERVDARAWDGDWKSGDFDDAGWERAHVIGPAGTAPWTKLLPRDIPFLTEEPIWPKKVESLKRVVSADWTAAIDLRSLFVPGSDDHANHVGYVGYIATVLRTDRQGLYSVCFPNRSWSKGCWIDGTYYGQEQFTGPSTERSLQIPLDAGDHLLLVDVSGTEHAFGHIIGLLGEGRIEAVSPLPQLSEPDGTAFVAIGPFAAFSRVDHEKPVHSLRQYRDFAFGIGTDLRDELDEEAFPDFAVYTSVRGIGSVEELLRLGDWVKPMPPAYVSRDSVFGLALLRKEEQSAPIPAALQRAVIAAPEPAVIPVYSDGDTELIIDFGKEQSGYIQFELETEAGVVIDWYGFEYMRDGWRQDTFNLENTLRYTCSEGRQTYVSPVRRGLRYLMLTVRGATKPVRLYSVQLVQSNYPVAETGAFHCSDQLLNEIWKISRYTTQLCMEDTFVDCPMYEQAFWVGDSRNEALVGYYVFGAVDIVKRCLRLVPGSAHQTPLYVDQVPSGWSSVIPNWTFFWVTACLEYAEHTGDTAFAAEIWTHVRYTLEHYLQRIDDRGVLYIEGWNLLDWAPMDQPGAGVVTPQNMFLVKSLRDAVRIAEFAGEGAAAEPLRAAGEQLRQSINEHLWSDEKSAYLDCIHADGSRSTIFSMQTQVVALLCGIADGGRRDRLEQLLLEPPTDFVQIGSPFMSFFLYETYAKLGRYDHMLDDMRLNYGKMVEYEASTCWEMYPSYNLYRANPNFLTRSHCHAWSAGPGYFLGADILGVRKAEPGWKRVVVAPQPTGLAWARGSVPLPDAGRIDVAWRVEDSNGNGEGGGTSAVPRLHVTVRAPEGLDVEVRFPDGFVGTYERTAL